MPDIRRSLDTVRFCSIVFKRVLATSRGVVMAAARAPAPAPDSMCERGLYCLELLKMSCKDSYEMK